MSLPNKNKLRSKIAKLNKLQQELEPKQAKLEDTMTSLESVSDTLIALDELAEKEGDKFEGFINIGSNVYVKAEMKLEKDKILQEIGAGVSLSLGIEKTRERLKRKQKRIRKEIQEKQKDVKQLIEKIQNLRSEIRQMQQNLQQGGRFR